MSKVEIDGVEYECPPEVAGLLQAVSEERDELQGVMARAIPKTFGRDLTELLNKHSIENVVDMPDFLLAGMICRMIEAMCQASRRRWTGTIAIASAIRRPTVLLSLLQKKHKAYLKRRDHGC